MDQDIIIKFCIVGQSGVGKTSMLYQYIYKRFDETVRPTIGCDFSTKLNSTIDGKPVRLQLWDIAGQERFTSVSKMYLRGALGCAVVCSASEKNTLEQTLKWKRIIEENSEFDDDVKIPCLLVQNKSDLITGSPEEWQKKEFLNNFAKTNDFCGFIQSSAKDNQNIEQIFQILLDETKRRDLIIKKNASSNIHAQHQQRMSSQRTENKAVRLTNEKSGQNNKVLKKKNCC